LTSQPFFTIAVPTYNRRVLLKKTLDSLLSQTYQNFEIIIGNDYTQEFLTQKKLGYSDKRLRIVNNKKNLGELKNMNSLIKLAKGKYFIWIFDDDPCAPVLLELVIKSINNFNWPLVIFPSYAQFYGEKKVEFKNSYADKAVAFSGKDFISAYLNGRIKILGCCAFYDIEYLRKHGGVKKLSESSYALHSEYLLILQAGLLSKVIYIPTPLVASRDHQGSWSSSNKDFKHFMSAGYKLIEESIKIFMNHNLQEDFVINIKKIIDFVFASVVVKLIESDKKFSKIKFNNFFCKIKSLLSKVKNKNFRMESLKNLDRFRSRIFIFIIKGHIKNILNANNLYAVKSIYKKII